MTEYKLEFKSMEIVYQVCAENRECKQRVTQLLQKHLMP